MSQSDIDIRLAMDATPLLSDLERMQRALLLSAISRALSVATANGYELVRLVVGHRLARRLGSSEKTGPGIIRAIYGVPVTVDTEAPEGFGLVTRPPAV